MANPPDWPHRCPQCGRYLSQVQAVMAEGSRIPLVVLGHCKIHGEVNSIRPQSYAPHLWEGK